MKSVLTPLLLLIVLGAPIAIDGQAENTNATLSNTNTSSPVSTPSPIVNDINEQTIVVSFNPPWGEPTFGRYFGSIIYNSGFQYLLDIRRYGWSWTPSYLRKSAPFCYDIYPRPSWAQSKYSFHTASTCYEVTTMCDALGGTVLNDVLCMEDPAKPFTVVGPVCWNDTCYNTKTFDTCQAVGGQFIGGKYDTIFNASTYNEHILSEDDAIGYGDDRSESDAAWCAVPGKHTLVGPTCFGQECFQKELSAACSTSLNGTSFADIYCLVDDTYTVIGPICTPTPWNLTKDASVCYPEETVALCQDLGGTSIGDIFCVVKGDYSVLGPFCQISSSFIDPAYLSSQCYNGTDSCNALGGTPMGKGAFCVLKGEYSHVRPNGPASFYLTSQNENTTWCESQGGTDIVHKFDIYDYGVGCILKGKYSTVGPMSWGEHPGTSFDGDEIGGNIAESDIIQSIDSLYVILKGEYSVYGPSCFGFSCHTGSSDCWSAGGASFGGVFCAVANNSTRTIMKTNTTSEVVGNDSTDAIEKKNKTSNVVATNSTDTFKKTNLTSAAKYHDIFMSPVMFMPCMIMSLKFIWSYI